MTDTPSKKGAISRVSSQAAAAEAALVERVRRQRKAREAIGAEPEAPKRRVTCRVLPLGDGLISQGEHAAGLGDGYFDREERFEVAEDIAQALETRGFVEILGEAAPAAAEPADAVDPEPAEA
jgi:hypothetical protein